METIKYKVYSRKQMLKIIQEDGFLFVETNLGNKYVIRKKDLADFIILEALRTGHIAQMEVYMPGIDSPVITTFGWFLNKANPLLREEIIKRLVLLQTTNTKPRNVRVFDNDMFNKLNSNDMGIIDGKVKNFDKLYRKYEVAQSKYNIEMEGV